MMEEEVEWYFVINSEGIVDFESEEEFNGEKMTCSDFFFEDEYKLAGKRYIYSYHRYSDGMRTLRKIVKIEKVGSDFWFRFVYCEGSRSGVDWPKITLWKAKKVRI
jgi:hypothetical protein